MSCGPAVRSLCWRPSARARRLALGTGRILYDGPEKRGRNPLKDSTLEIRIAKKSAAKDGHDDALKAYSRRKPRHTHPARDSPSS
jgi:hypothetical protein